MEESSYDLFEILPLDLPGRTEGNHRKFESGLLVFRL